MAPAGSALKSPKMRVYDEARGLQRGLDHEANRARVVPRREGLGEDVREEGPALRVERAAEGALAERLDELGAAGRFARLRRITADQRVELLDRVAGHDLRGRHVPFGEELTHDQGVCLVVEDARHLVRGERRGRPGGVAEEVANGVVVLEACHSPRGRFARVNGHAVADERGFRRIRGVDPRTFTEAAHAGCSASGQDDRREPAPSLPRARRHDCPHVRPRSWVGPRFQVAFKHPRRVEHAWIPSKSPAAEPRSRFIGFYVWFSSGSRDDCQ